MLEIETEVSGFVFIPAIVNKVCDCGHTLLCLDFCLESSHLNYMGMFLKSGVPKDFKAFGEMIMKLK